MVGGVVGEYLRLMEVAWRRHRRHYAFLKVLNVFLKVCGGLSGDEAVERFRRTPQGLAKFLSETVNELVRSGMKPKSVRSLMQLLKNFLEYYDVPVANEWRKVKMPKAFTARADTLPSLDVLQRLVLAPRSPRMQLLLQLLMQTGMRIGEAIQLKTSYIDFNVGKIRLPGYITKTGRPREIPIHPELAEALKKYLQHNNSEYLFPSESGGPWSIGWLRLRYHELLTRLGLDEKTVDGGAYRLHFHVFRKWFRSRCEAAGVNPVMLDRWLGHGGGVRHVYTLFDAETERKETAKMVQAVRLFGVVRTEADEDVKKRIESLEKEVVNLLYLLGKLEKERKKST
ncbi:MAG: tyrosine-type recombinase/integrase [Candidatus Caldarchaeum sp.]